MEKHGIREEFEEETSMADLDLNTTLARADRVNPREWTEITMDRRRIQECILPVSRSTGVQSMMDTHSEPRWNEHSSRQTRSNDKKVTLVRLTSHKVRFSVRRAL